MTDQATPTTNATLPTASTGRVWQIVFTGSGSEYFRIWIVNLMLILVTVGLYLPFAKARRMKYFYANTLVDGHALAFHGNPWLMLRGFLLTVALGGACALANQSSDVASLTALGAFCLMYPTLWRAGLRFRLANTGWRGLRMAYRARLKDTWYAMLPIYIPLVALGFTLAWDITMGHLRLSNYQKDDELWDAMYLIGMAVILPLAPWSLTLMKRVQHGAYTWAQERTVMTAPMKCFYAVCLKGALVLAAIYLTIVVLAVVTVVALTTHPIISFRFTTYLGQILTITLGLSGYVMTFLIVVPLFISRLQNLVWSNTRSANLQFHSALHFGPLARLTAKNLFRTAITFGLYRPFAVVSMAKMRLEAVSITAEGDVDSWLGTAQASQMDTTGEAAGDFFGFDPGL